MMRSMYAGVSGLRVHQSRMDVIGNNISNVNTVGFKSERMTFSDMYYQTLQGASGSNPENKTAGINPMQIGLGAAVGSIDSIMTEGAAQRTDRSLDMKIEGDGFFIVNNNDGNFFTRAGVFNLDNQGYLATPKGHRLMGWNVDKDGKVVQGQVEPLQVYSPQFSYSAPSSTINAQLSGNIDKSDERIKLGGTGYVFTLPVYDKLGYKYTVKYSLTKSTVDTDPKAYVVQLQSVIGPDGEETDLSTGSGKNVKITGNKTGDTDTTVELKFLADGTLDPAGNTSFKIQDLEKITGGKFASLETEITVDFSQIKMYAGKTNIETKRGDANGIGAGREPGVLSGFAVGLDGKITGKYTNGDTRTLGQVVVNTFSNPAGLVKKGDNLFEATANSGDFDGIGKDVQSTGGGIASGVLEMSNVDLSKEFTEMIVTQRGYQANSKIITVSDEMLQELVNLVR